MNLSLLPSPVVIVLTQTSVPLARRIIQDLPGGQIYGLSTRVTDADVFYEEFGPTLRELFTVGTPIIGICAAGILIRTLASLLNNKYLEPPVIAVAEDGSAVVPLLGGLHGVNDLARIIASRLEIPPGITTTGDIRFRTTLLNPPPGYILANPEDAKGFIANLIAGHTLKLIGDAPWLYESKLPIVTNGNLTIQVTEKNAQPSPSCLVYHPQKIILAIASNHSQNFATNHLKIDRELILTTLAEHNLAINAIAGIFCPLTDGANPSIIAIAKQLNRPLRFLHHEFRENAIVNATTIVAEILKTSTSEIIPIVSTPEITCLAAISTKIIHPQEYGQPRGKLTIVGTGPGDKMNMSPQVQTALANATDLVGYTTYLNLVSPLLPGQTRHDSDNRQELDRARFALDLAVTGKNVVLVSSGDPGIYAMATAVFEVIDTDNNPAWSTVEIEVAPGISAVQTAAAKVGAPIGHDFCVISLSDILKPWSIIAQRIEAAAAADFVIAFYNPVSKTRKQQLVQAQEILLRYRHPHTPVILGKNLTRSKEEVIIQTLAELNQEQVDMGTVIIVGSSRTKIIPRHDGGMWVYTPRWYD